MQTCSARSFREQRDEGLAGFNSQDVRMIEISIGRGCHNEGYNIHSAELELDVAGGWLGATRRSTRAAQPASW